MQLFFNFFQTNPTMTRIVITAIILPIIIYIIRIKRKKKAISNVFKDLVRHYWRNGVVLQSIKEMMSEESNKDLKPAAFHFEKLVSSDFFNKIANDISNPLLLSSKTGSMFHEIQLIIRNVDLESKSAVSYLNNKDYNVSSMTRLVDVLIFKQGLLIKTIAGSSKDLNLTYNESQLLNYMITGNDVEKIRSFGIGDYCPRIFFEHDQFADIFKEDVSIEKDAKRILLM